MTLETLIHEMRELETTFAPQEISVSRWIREIEKIPPGMRKTIDIMIRQSEKNLEAPK